MATAADFRNAALSFGNVEEREHGGQPAFYVEGRKFAGLASIAEGYGNLTLTPELQAEFVSGAPDIFVPIAGGFGRMGHTHIMLRTADKAVLHGALQAAYNLRISKNLKAKRLSRAQAIKRKT